MNRLLGSAALSTILLLAGCGVSQSSSTSPTSSSAGTIATDTPSGTAQVDDKRFAFNVTGGRAEPGSTRQRVVRGETVTIAVMSDTADEVHVHGYDRTIDLQPGRPGSVTFVADIPGVFEVELHNGHRELMKLEVN